MATKRPKKPSQQDKDEGATIPAPDRGEGEASANRASTGAVFTSYPEAAEEHDPSPTERTEGERP